MPRVVKRFASQAIKSGPSRRGVPLPPFVSPQRRAASLAEAAIGETDPVGLDKLRWGGVVIVLGHRSSLVALPLKPRCDAVEGGRLADRGENCENALREDRP